MAGAGAPWTACPTADLFPQISVLRAALLEYSSAHLPGHTARIFPEFASKGRIARCVCL